MPAPGLKKIPRALRAPRALLRAGVFLLLSGCALLPPPDGSPSPVFLVSGKIVARLDSAPARAASFEWRRLRTPDGDYLDRAVFTRHGVVVARVEIAPRGIEVRTADGVYEGDHLPEEHLGVAAPLRALGFWLSGESDPSASTHESTLPGGAIRRIRQHGWEIVYAERDAAGRPLRIEAAFPGGRAEIRGQWAETGGGRGAAQ